MSTAVPHWIPEPLPCAECDGRADKTSLQQVGRLLCSRCHARAVRHGERAATFRPAARETWEHPADFSFASLVEVTLTGACASCGERAILRLDGSRPLAEYASLALRCWRCGEIRQASDAEVQMLIGRGLDVVAAGTEVKRARMRRAEVLAS